MLFGQTISEETRYETNKIGSQSPRKHSEIKKKKNKHFYHQQTLVLS